MAEEIDPTLLKKTQEILSSVIKKPALTDKNLKRPPFRFLHDIITNVIKSSGFMKGLYSSEELQSENIKDKDSKIVFLQKTIDLLAIVTNESIDLKPTKVVAGHEVQKTNEFLQILGIAAKSKIDTKEAVQVILQKSNASNAKERRASVDKRLKNASEKPHLRSTTKTIDKKASSQAQSKEVKTKDSEKVRSRSKEPRTKEKVKDKTHTKQEDSKNRDTKKKSSSSKIARNDSLEADESPKKKPSSMQNGYAEDQAGDHSANGMTFGDDDVMASNMQTTEQEQPSPMKELTGEPESSVKQSNDTPKHEAKPQRQPSSQQARPPSARSKRTKLEAASAHTKNSASQELDVSVRDTLASPLQRPMSTRPSSSRPAPPRIKIRHIVENEEPSIRPETAKPVENVIVDNKLKADDDEEEDEAFVVIEEPVTNDLETSNMHATMAQEFSEDDKGSLVKQLLETKKDLEGGSQLITKKTEIDKSQIAVNRSREASSKELEQLQAFIQSVSKTAYPLGRMLDYLQEDVDSMKMELRTWKEEHAQNLSTLRREKNVTESILEPLRVQLDDLDQLVQDQLDANSVLKATILRNEEKMQRMMAAVRRKS